MSTSCGIVGDADMYGFGIRVGFYLQWCAIIASEWLAPSEVVNMRTSNNLFLAATFLALVVKTVRNVSELRASEVYVVLLFTFGRFAMLIPAVLIRVLVCGSPQWDPWRTQKVPSSDMHKFLFNVIICMVSGFGLWFWAAGIHINSSLDCEEYGFLFHKIPLKANWFRTLNIVLNACCLGIVLFSICNWIFRRSRLRFHRRDRDGEVEIHKGRKQLLEITSAISACIISVTLVAAVELTIHWNGIQNVHHIDSAGQTIPFILGIGAILRVIYKAIFSQSGDTTPIYDFSAPRETMATRDPSELSAPFDFTASIEPAIITRRPTSHDSGWS